MDRSEISNNQGDFSLRDFYYIVFRHLKKSVVFFIIVVVAAAVYVMQIPDIYVSTASILVTVGRENIEMIPTTGEAISVSRSNKINTEVEILRNIENFKEVIDIIGLDRFYVPQKNEDPPTEEQLSLIRSNIAEILSNRTEISITRGTDIIEVAYGSRYPDLAQKIVSNLITVFQEKRTAIHYSGSQYNFYLEQYNATRKSLDELEAKINALKTSMITGESSEDVSNLMSRIEALQQERDSNSSSIAECKSQITYLRQELRNNTPQQGGDTDQVQRVDVQAELNSLLVRKQELLTRYTEDNAQVKEINRQIEELRKVQTTDNPEIMTSSSLYQQLQSQLADQRRLLVALQSRGKSLEEKLGQLKKEVSSYNQKATQLAKLERERDNLVITYNNYSNSLEESKIDRIVQEQKISNVKVIQPATFPTRPMASRKYRNLLLGFFVGIFGGVGIAFASEYFDHSIKRQDEIGKWLELRPLASIPYKKDIGDLKANR